MKLKILLLTAGILSGPLYAGFPEEYQAAIKQNHEGDVLLAQKKEDEAIAEFRKMTELSSIKEYGKINSAQGFIANILAAKDQTFAEPSPPFRNMRKSGLKGTCKSMLSEKFTLKESLPMNLYEALLKRGYTFRQHLEEEGWGWAVPTVVDLNNAQQDFLESDGIKGLKKRIESQRYRPPEGLFTFPSYEIEEPLSQTQETLLWEDGAAATVIAPGKNSVLAEMASEWGAYLEKKYHVRLPLVMDSEAKPDLLKKMNLIVFGASHQNRFSLTASLRYRTLFADASVPGEDGLLITTLCGLEDSGHTMIQIVAPEKLREEALDHLKKNLKQDGNRLSLKKMHMIKPGKVMKKHFPDWNSFVRSLPKRLPRLEDRDVRVPSDIRKLSELLMLGLDNGGMEQNYYTAAPLDITIDCARYYQMSADPRALQLFREMLFRLADYYLKKPGGACYPSDMDFRLGLLVLYYSRLEHETVFDAEDRLILDNLLLSCAKSVYEYALKIWPADKMGENRFNHQTFPALSLVYASGYFRRFSLPCVNDWMKYAEDVFRGNLWKRFKQVENARSYESFIYDHAAAYAFFTGRGLDLFQNGCYEKMAKRQIVATDNFFRPVDYGDTGITLEPADSLSARFLAGECGRHGLFRWFAGEVFAKSPIYFKSFLDFPGLTPERKVASAPSAGNWEFMELDPDFRKEMYPGMPARYAFDKLAFRSGWKDNDHYLLLEGLNGKPEHSHRESNGIVRLNHLGRHWVVSNGYGRRTGVTSVTQSYSTRECGPKDHNVLVLERNGKIVQDQPPAVLLQMGAKEEVLYSTTALLGYGGVDWFRTLVAVCGKYLIVIDRIRILENGLKRGRIEWNCLGNGTPCKQGVRLEQKGVFMDILSASGWKCELSVADQSASWKKVLDSKKYKYADFPLTKLLFHLPDLSTGTQLCLGTLLVASNTGGGYEIRQTGTHGISVSGAGGGKVRIHDGDLRIQAGPESCDIQFDPIPELPAELEKWRETSLEKSFR